MIHLTFDKQEIYTLIDTELLQNWPQKLGPRPHHVSLQYFNYSSFENRIWIRKGKLVVKLHKLMLRRPMDEQLALVRLLIHKLLGRPPLQADRLRFDQCVRALNLPEWYKAKEFQIRFPRKKSKPKSITQGEYRNLDDSYQRVVQQMFNGEFERPDISWSPRKAKTRLGSYRHNADRLLISRVLDSKRVPLYVLDYVVYHELLHKKYPIRQHPSGRRIVHSPEFLAAERLYPDYARAEEFIRTKL